MKEGKCGERVESKREQRTEEMAGQAVVRNAIKLWGPTSTRSCKPFIPEYTREEYPGRHTWSDEHYSNSACFMFPTSENISIGSSSLWATAVRTVTASSGSLDVVVRPDICFG